MLLLLCLVPVLAGIVQYLSPFSVWTGTVSNITNSSIPSIQQNAGWDASRHRILTAMHGYSRYREKNLESTNRWRDFYKRIPKRQRSTIDDVVQYTRKLNTVEHLFDTNEELTRGILNHGLEYYNISQTELDEFIHDAEKQGKRADRTSVNQAMKHYVRDWAAEGARERAVFECILDAISEFKQEIRPQTPLKVLLPGAGLGRLGHEIDALGDTEVTINEYSAYMALAYHYLTTLPPNSQTFHPFIDWWSHHATTADMQRPITFPEAVPSPSVTLVEGDFTTIFTNKTSHFDVLVTFFFIDTAQNLVTYLETIHALLRPGGLWVNLGPLLYGTAPFLQLSLEEVLLLSESIGFELRDGKEDYGRVTVPGLKARTVEVLYGSNERGLSWNGYKGQFWIARRK